MVAGLTLTPNGDMYEIDGILYERATRVLSIMTGGDFLVDWAIRLTAESAEELGFPTLVGRLKEKGTAKTRKAADRGTLVHEYIASFLDKNIPTIVNEEYGGYLTAAKSFLEDYAIEPMRVECVVCDPLGYAGTVDLVGIQEQWGSVLVDWKTGKPHHEHELQLNAYMGAMDIATGDKLEVAPDFQMGYVVYIQADGTYKVQEYAPTSTAFDAFLGLLAAWRWKNATR